MDFYTKPHGFFFIISFSIIIILVSNAWTFYIYARRQLITIYIFLVNLFVFDICNRCSKCVSISLKHYSTFFFPFLPSLSLSLTHTHTLSLSLSHTHTYNPEALTSILTGVGALGTLYLCFIVKY